MSTAERIAPPKLSTTRRSITARIIAHKTALMTLVVLLTLSLLAFAAPLIESLFNLSATEADIYNRFQPPSLTHFLGTDELGRDVFARLLYGGQVSLMVGMITALTAAVIGTIIGLIAGVYKGWMDALLMRLTDGIIALPLLPLLIILAAIDPGKLPLPESITGAEHFSLIRIIVILALFGWTTVARLVRASTLSVMENTYILAAEALGVKKFWVITRHVLPNVLAPLIVATTLSIGNVILLESVLSFLGLGIQPPMPSWGNMLTNAQDLIWENPWLAVYPGMMIFITVIAFNLLGDALQDIFNPRTPSR
jgi:peptide/nickel transport system permease protein